MMATLSRVQAGPGARLVAEREAGPGRHRHAAVADLAALPEQRLRPPVPSLTTVNVDGAAIGRLAGEMIVARGRAETVPERIVEVGFEVVQRQSA
ncbi:hypothetical protein [Rhodoplanes sp. SY1]|uniref:hypothetical protein n=1 Tax=Rhodoplanes sp. SY1 TaxID=3166646 RepID=UPI0038B4ABE4